ncbi:MAG: HNH endonuclease [Pseudomonadota bacterium]
MAKAIFTYKPDSRYDDDPAIRYQFPRTYLKVAERAVGDWIVYYEPRRTEGEKAGGRQAYFAVAKVVSLSRDPRNDDLFVAHMDEFLPFSATPRFETSGIYFESALRRDDGKTNMNAFRRAMRLVPEAEFDAILTAGFQNVRAELGEGDWFGAERIEIAPTGFAAPNEPFEGRVAPRRIVERLSARPFRDAAFARNVKEAYANTCAMTGLHIVNGGGRPEVQAAHIRPVKDHGPDSVRNGLALSGTAHWMFDRGLISVDGDFSILIAEDRLPEPAKALLTPERRLIVPKQASMAPHPTYLSFHRENVFKG